MKHRLPCWAYVLAIATVLTSGCATSDTVGVGGASGAGATAGASGVGGSVGAAPSVFPCTEQGIRNAIAEGGGPHTFDCDGPTTVVTEAEIVIENDVILDGGEELKVDGDKDHRVFFVAEGVTAELRGFTVIRGAAIYPDQGGGILNQGELTLANSVVRGNTAEDDFECCRDPRYNAGGGISNHGDLTVIDSEVSGNVAFAGAGIWNQGTLSMVADTVSGNSGAQGAGIFNALDALVDAVNSTISGNIPEAVYNQGTFVITSSTISGEDVEGRSIIINSVLGELTIAGSVVDGDCDGTITSGGYNIESGRDTCGFGQDSDQVNVGTGDLRLGPLADNGGSTDTHALAFGSVAIDAIPVAECELDQDQRGVTRPQHAACDVGAFEAHDDGGLAGNGGAGGEGGFGGVAGIGGLGGSAVGGSGDGGSNGNGGAVGVRFPCAEMGIRDAIAEGGGPHGFDCPGPTTVATVAEIVIDNDVVLDGEGNLTVDGDNDHRVFSIAVGVTATLRGLTATGGTVAFPQGGGGIFNAGRLVLMNSTVTENVAMPSPCGKGGPCYGLGGGINNQGELVLLGSTVSENTAQYGGGISSGDPFTSAGNSTVAMTVTNSTMSGNSAVYGGGILHGGFGTISVTSSTMSGNTAPAGSAIASTTHDRVTVNGSLVDGDCFEDSVSTNAVVSNDYNIESPGDTCGFDEDSDRVGVSAEELKLGGLADNGGPTLTHALLPESVAIDQIPGKDCEVRQDQRGVARPQGAACDVGAFESGAIPERREYHADDQ